MFQHRQIHVWISESDYFLLREQAEVTRESVSSLIRRMIKGERQRLKQADAAVQEVSGIVPAEADDILESLAS